uniref:Nudix hydrolase domain-containing protein n=1 Tax=Odontella aurita TaxID=265563 RepID=A0A6U6LR16_9STRA|mmetsp:Transcript_9490/g.28491  ORF Transcript_9490/g.28491 Transcript_9490/m.28491 type:complete len:449 (+) Transcript_9490:381-1727(+)
MSGDMEEVKCEHTGSGNKLFSTPEPARRPVDSQVTPFRSIGRIKAPPICRAEALTKESLSSEELSKMCWSSLISNAILTPGQVSHGSARSSTSAGGDAEKQPDSLPAPPKITQPAPFKRMTSRNGRETQRWVTDAATNHLFRLTTGTVPIMRDGRILFCSASRKEEWILPKGGWEADETIEESALRETFEEGGVLGILGPKLEEIEYETRKAKKRRLEREDRIKKFKEEAERRNSETIATSEGHTNSMPLQQPPPSAVVSVQSHSSCGASSEDEHLAQSTAQSVSEVACINPAKNNFPVTDVSSREFVKGSTFGDPTAASAGLPGRRIRDTSSQSDAGFVNDDTASVTSAASITSDASTSCAHVRMSLFPLYVTEVKDEWPESGRARKVMDIDAAIKMMEPRPEFRAVLLEVRKKGLHLSPPVQEDNDRVKRDNRNSEIDRMDAKDVI